MSITQRQLEHFPSTERNDLFRSNRNYSKFPNSAFRLVSTLHFFRTGPLSTTNSTTWRHTTDWHCCIEGTHRRRMLCLSPFRNRFILVSLLAIPHSLLSSLEFPNAAFVLFLCLILVGSPNSERDLVPLSFCSEGFLRRKKACHQRSGFSLFPPS